MNHGLSHVRLPFMTSGLKMEQALLLQPRSPHRAHRGYPHKVQVFNQMFLCFMTITYNFTLNIVWYTSRN